jgi:ankyrin repeat protein
MNYSENDWFDAVYHGEYEKIDKIIKSGFDINTVNETDGNALIIAVGDNDLALTKLLVENGIDINAIDEEGNSPILCAASLGETLIVKYLLENGADIYHKNYGGYDSFDLACHWGYTETVDYLLSKNVEITIPVLWNDPNFETKEKRKSVLNVIEKYIDTLSKESLKKYHQMRLELLFFDEKKTKSK